VPAAPSGRSSTSVPRSAYATLPSEPACRSGHSPAHCISSTGKDS
jgi:hypothetical protein